MEMKKVQSRLADYNNDSSRKNDLRRLLPRHYKIMELRNQGYTVKDIAQALCLSQGGVSNIINSPLFKDESARRNQIQDKQLSEARNEQEISSRDYLRKHELAAAKKLTSLMNSQNEKIAQSSAIEILNRVDGSAQEDGAKIYVEADALKTLLTALNETNEELSRKAVECEVIDGSTN